VWAIRLVPFGILELASSTWANKTCVSSDGNGNLGPAQMILSFSSEKLKFNWDAMHTKEKNYIKSMLGEAQHGKQHFHSLLTCWHHRVEWLS
jgi:hypothetical protein